MERQTSSLWSFIHPNTKIKSNSIPYTQIKLISTPLLKPSQIDPHSKSSQFRCLRTKKQFNFDPHTKTKHFSTPTQNHVNSDPCTEVKLISVQPILMPQHQNQVNFDPYTKTKYISTPTLKQGNFDPYTEIKSSSIPHINQVTFAPHTKTNLFSIQRLKPSHFQPPHQTQVNSDPYTEIKSSWIPHDEIKSISTPHT